MHGQECIIVAGPATIYSVTVTCGSYCLLVILHGLCCNHYIIYRPAQLFIIVAIITSLIPVNIILLYASLSVLRRGMHMGMRIMQSLML